MLQSMNLQALSNQKQIWLLTRSPKLLNLSLLRTDVCQSEDRTWPTCTTRKQNLRLRQCSLNVKRITLGWLVERQRINKKKMSWIIVWWNMSINYLFLKSTKRQFFLR